MNPSTLASSINIKQSVFLFLLLSFVVQFGRSAVMDEAGNLFWRLFDFFVLCGQRDG
jgi:hypothetical protein